jgi:glucose-6-phosphate isomerase
MVTFDYTNFLDSAVSTPSRREFYDIDASDQPGVEYGKKLTFCLMDRPGFEEQRLKIEAEQRKLRRTVG